MMPWDAGFWDGGFWDSDVPTPPVNNETKPKKRKAMKRQNYYPSRLAEQANWLENYAAKVAIYGATLGLTAGQITATANDAKWCHYVIGTWLTAVRAFSPSTTDAVDDVLTGGGNLAVALPTFTPPALPAGTAAQLPGALTRIFDLIGAMKRAAGYTEAIGTDMRIIGAEDSVTAAAPRFTADAVQGAGSQSAVLKFFKYGHMGVHIESRRGNGPWEFLSVDTESPYMDERALLAAGQPEVREYRMRFWDKGTANGDWTDVVKLTVSP